MQVRLLQLTKLRGKRMKGRHSAAPCCWLPGCMQHAFAHRLTALKPALPHACLLLNQPAPPYCSHLVQEVEKEDRSGDKHTMTAVKLQVVVEKV